MLSRSKGNKGRSGDDDDEKAGESENVQSRGKRVCTFRSKLRMLVREVQNCGIDWDEVCKEEGSKSKESEAEQSFDPMSNIGEPSELTSYQVWKKYQYNSLKKPRWKCYRGPPEAEPQLPLALLHQSFELFWQMNGDHGLHLVAVDFKLADKIWNIFTAGCEDEEKDITEPLNLEFIRYLGAVITRMTTTNKTGGFGFFGISEGSFGIEDKREGADALFELSEYFRQSFRTNAKEGFGRLSHAVGVVRSLPYVQFLAVVMDWESKDSDNMEGTLMVEPLTDMINCWGPKDLGVVRLARALKAFKYFVNNYYPESFLDCSRPYLLADWLFVKSLTGKVSQDNMVFGGVDANGNMRVAKFTSTYSKDAHAAWSSLGLAPQLHEFKELASGWKFVVMDYLREEEGWRSAVDIYKDHMSNKPVLKQVKETLIEALKKGHEAGFVHGDFRLPNLFLKEVTSQTDKVGFDVKVIDFDWSGPCGTATYPVPLSLKHSWHRDAQAGKRIEPDHDYEFIKKLAE